MKGKRKSEKAGRERERRKKSRRATRERRAAIETTGEPQVAI